MPSCAVRLRLSFSVCDLVYYLPLCSASREERQGRVPECAPGLQVLRGVRRRVRAAALLSMRHRKLRITDAIVLRRYKASEDEASCVPARENVTMSELVCGADAGTVGFLTADPELGCVCKTEITENFCGGADPLPSCATSTSRLLI